MGHLTMSSKEARRPGLIQAALAGKLTNREGALALGISVRQFRRLKAACQREGVERLMHGNRGRPSSRRLKEIDRARIVELLKDCYAGLNDCHLTEKLRELEGLVVCRETVRQIRLSEQIAPARRRRAPQHRARRLRAAREGALVLIDSSQHLWFEDRGPLWNQLGALDDASGKLLTLHFRPHEDLHGYTELLRRLVTDYGLPGTLYGDRLGVFVRNDDHWTLEEQLAGQQDLTQFGSMLAELAVGFIAACSPQAKGRIERLWETLQDRLVSELRLRGIRTVEAAEAFLPEFSRDYNQRFARPARECVRAWRSAPRNFESILSCRYLRVVARDNTVTLPGRWVQLPPRPGGRSWQGCRVEARELLDGRLQVFHHEPRIAEHPWPHLQPFTLVPRDSATPAHRAALGIDLPESTRIDDRMAAKVRGPVPADAASVSTPTSADHDPTTPGRASPKSSPSPKRLVRGDIITLQLGGQNHLAATANERCLTRPRRRSIACKIARRALAGVRRRRYTSGSPRGIVPAQHSPLGPKENTVRTSLTSTALLASLLLAAIGPARGAGAGPNESIAPSFALKGVDGRGMRLSDYKGRAVVLDFWATWCGPCRATLPHLNDVQERFGPQGLVVLGVSVDDTDSKTIRRFADRLGVKFRIALADERVLDSYGPIRSIPTTFFINRRGEVVRRVVGYIDAETLEAYVRELF
jgi:peroxiredoxin/transposase